MEELIIKIETDIAVNKRCLQEDISSNIRKILELWIKYDEELLFLIKKIQIESKGE